MRVSYPGFAGGDRTDIALPAIQQKLLEALHATGKPVVLVLTTGSALGLRWAQDNLPAVLVAWYPGQQGGNAVADVLFGDANPAGRLPVTFYESVGQLPAFDDYTWKGARTGTSAASPSTRSASVCHTRSSSTRACRSRGAELGAKESLEVSVAVKNVGSRAGDEVVQLYVRPGRNRPGPETPSARSAASIGSASRQGEQKRVRFTIVPARDLATYDEARKAYVAAPGEYENRGGRVERRHPRAGTSDREVTLV